MMNFEKRNRIFSRTLEFIILPILVLLTGLTIEYKTGLFQKIIDSKSDSNVVDDLTHQKVIHLVDSIQREIFDEGYSVLQQKVISKFQTDIRVYNEILGDEILASNKVKGGKIFDIKDSIGFKNIGTNRVEFCSFGMFNEIVTVDKNNFFRMRTTFDEAAGSINFTTSENSNNDYPIQQILIKVDNKLNICKLIGYYHKNQKEKFLLSQEQILDRYADNIIFWRTLLNKE